MSNQEEAEFLNNVQLPGEVKETASDIDSRIIGLDNDNGLRSPQELQTVTAAPQEPHIEMEKPKFTPKLPPKKIVEAKEEPVTEAEASTEDIRDAEIRLLKQQMIDAANAIKLLVAGRDGVVLKPTPKAIDWTKMSEKDVFDMSVPIQLVDHQMPDYMKVALKDSNFVPRWVQKLDRRLGPMKAKGFNFVREDEIDGELNIAIQVNADGIFQHDDVFLMKIEKRLYYGMLRANHERALKMVDPKAAHKIAQDRVINDMTSAKAEDSQTRGRDDRTQPGDYQRYANQTSNGKSKLEVYI